jgi:glycosyltransferase involved in cell wall biosynthesis
MNRKKILWLCSWYPSPADPFNGDFIQRHAKAAALYNDIYVLHISGANDCKPVAAINNSSEGLTEKIILYKNWKGIAGKLINHFNWNRIYKKAVKDFIRENGIPDLVHVHVPMKAGLIAMWIKRKFSVPYIVTEHWGIYNDVLKENYAAKPVWFKKLTKNIFLHADVASSVSNYLAGKIKKYVSPELKFQITSNTADILLFFYKAKPKEKFRFIHISNMIPLKNAEGLMMAFHELQKTIKEVELVIVGPGYYSLEAMALDFGLLNQSVFFRGEISYSKVAEEIQQSDCLVIFSNIENSPCVISESLCCGVPVIATNVGGIPELVSSSNSILVEPGNTQQLQEVMKKMINSYSSYDKSKIAEDAQSKFSYSVIGKKIDELYQSVIK